MAEKKQAKQPRRPAGQVKKKKASTAVPFAQSTKEIDALMKKHGLKTKEDLARFLTVE